MEFGRITLEELTKTDFSLPPDPERNIKVLPGKPGDTKFFTGLPKWGRTEWVGTLYPVRTREKDFLKYYVTHFNAVELNATHYKLYGSGGIGKWADLARDRTFRFCPKMYKGITHVKGLQHKQFMVSEFLRGVETFGEHLGPIFIQLSDSFSNKRKAELFQFMESLPDRLPFFLEVRHANLIANVEVYDFLQSKGFGVVITDTAGRRDAAHMNLTIPKTLIRFIATGHEVDLKRIKFWAERLKDWMDHGIEEIYFFIHPFDERKDLDLMKYAINQFNLICNAKLPPLLLNN
jgi:uncharacterized protein YecE (DUF72 family)